ncbi:hypothetical protein TcCL_NonESM01183 [Trypanosoma cruzi]|nr:hypothetical protein TcCL_NonESM01183 [Trypanosoma cruzi]
MLLRRSLYAVENVTAPLLESSRLLPSLKPLALSNGPKSFPPSVNGALFISNAARTRASCGAGAGPVATGAPFDSLNSVNAFANSESDRHRTEMDTPANEFEKKIH